MKITIQQRTQYKDRFVELVKNFGKVENSILHHSGLWKGSQSLIQEIRKNSEVASLILPQELFFIIFDFFLELRNLRKDMTDFAFGQTLTDEELLRASESFVALIEGLPYQHEYYFQIPIELPSALPSIQIFEGVHLLAPMKTEAEFFATKPGKNVLLAALMGIGPQKIAESDIFLKVSLRGYGEQVQAEAMSVLKRFLYLGISEGFLSNDSWDRKSGRAFEKQKYCLHGLAGDEWKGFSLPGDLASFVSGVRLSPTYFEGFTKPEDASASSTILYGHRSYENFFEGRVGLGCLKFSQRSCPNTWCSSVGTLTL